MIYFMPICDADQMEEQYRAWFPHLPSTRQRKLMQYRFAKDRWLCAAAYMLLLYALKNEYNLAADHIKIEVAASGKPYLSSHPHIHFNLSHCDAGVACGISDTPIGIDVETVRQIDDYVVRRVCSASEQEILKHSENTELEFTVMWTLKESWVKAIGDGLAFPLDRVNVQGHSIIACGVFQDGYQARPYIVSFSVVLSVCLRPTLDEHKSVSIVTPTIATMSLSCIGGQDG